MSLAVRVVVALVSNDSGNDSSPIGTDARLRSGGVGDDDSDAEDRR